MFDTCLDELISDIILGKICQALLVAVSSLHQDMRQLLFNFQFFEQLDDIHHDQSELLVSINHLQLTAFVTVEVYLPVSITIEAHPFCVLVIVWRPRCWKLSLFVHELSATVFVQ